MYQERFYRQSVSSQFSLEVSYKESDLYIGTDREINKETALSILKKYYKEVEDYSKINPSFLTSLSPLAQDKDAPSIIQDMINCSLLAGVGPFASVAGAIALYVGKEILQFTPSEKAHPVRKKFSNGIRERGSLTGFTNEVIIENGGDIFLKITEDKRIGVYLGKRFAAKGGTEEITLKIKKRDYSFGIASSSSFIGHSLNFGKVDLVTVIAKDAVIADGFATALSNRVKKEDDIQEVLNLVQNVPLIEGILIAWEGKIFLWGGIELAE